MTRRAYAGVGSRETPAEIMTMMTAAARQLEEAGLILRSGGAKGADTAFEHGVWHWPNKQIFLPYGGFNKRRTVEPGICFIPVDKMEEANKIAAKHHPAWKKLPDNIRTFHIRNVAQVLGQDLDDPSLFVLCWTPNGAGGGGTGQAIRIATTYGVPVFDMGKMGLDTIAQSITQILEKL